MTAVLLVVAVVPMALTVSCTRYVEPTPVASEDLLAAGPMTSEQDCTPVDAPLTDIEAVDDGEPILRIPQLAIHLDRDVNERGLVLNRQQHLAPIWGVGADDGC